MSAPVFQLERRHVAWAVSLGLVLPALVGLGALAIPALVTQGSEPAANAPAIQTCPAAYRAGVSVLIAMATAVGRGRQR